MDIQEIEELIRLLEASNLSEIEVEEQGRRIRIQRMLSAPAAPLPMPAPAVALNPVPGASASSSIGAETAPALEPGMKTIDSPMVGTFYASPAPGEASFVNPGDRVEQSATVCIVEAMKLMNEVAAKFACIIDRALVENGQPVEFGQPLFAVRAI